MAMLSITSATFPYCCLVQQERMRTPDLRLPTTSLAARWQARSSTEGQPTTRAEAPTHPPNSYLCVHQRTLLSRKKNLPQPAVPLSLDHHPALVFQ